MKELKKKLELFFRGIGDAEKHERYARLRLLKCIFSISVVSQCRKHVCI